MKSKISFINVTPNKDAPPEVRGLLYDYDLSVSDTISTILRDLDIPDDVIQKITFKNSSILTDRHNELQVYNGIVEMSAVDFFDLLTDLRNGEFK